MLWLKHLAGILDHFRSRLSNGFAEAINGRVQAAKDAPRAYGSDAHLITHQLPRLRQAQAFAEEPMAPSRSTEPRLRVNHTDRERAVKGRSAIQALLYGQSTTAHP